MTSHILVGMKSEISVSEFKATCLAIIEEIRRTGKSIVVLKNGEPAVEIIPARPKSLKGRRLFGALSSEVLADGDVLSPLEPGLWEALK